MASLSSHISTTPLAPAAVATALGIIAARYLQGWWIAWTMLGILLLAGAISIVSGLHWPTRQKMRLLLLARSTFFTLIASGAFIIGFISLRMSQISELPAMPYMKGVIMEKASTTQGERLLVNTSVFLSDTGDNIQWQSAKMLLYTGATDAQVGDVIIYKGVPESVTNSENNAYLYARGIDYIINTDASKLSIVGTDNSIRFKALRCRDNIVSKLEKSSLSNESSAFAAAFMAGDKDFLSADTTDNFANAGIAHILALSGLHVGIILLLIGTVTYPLRLLKKHNLRYCIMGMALLLFAFISGLSMSVIRATVMALCLLGAAILQRRHTIINSLSAAACVILFFSPRSLFDAGFQLSFLCTLTIVILSPFIRITRKNRKRAKLARWIFIPCMLFLFSWPLSAYYFHRLPLFFLPLNLLILPLLPIYMACLIIYTSLIYCNIDFHALAAIINYSYEILSASTHWIASLRYSTIAITPHPALPLAAICFALITFYWLRSRSKTAYGIALMCGIAMLIMSSFPTQVPIRSMEIPTLYDRMEIRINDYGIANKYILPDGSFSHLRYNQQHIIYADANLCELTDTMIPNNPVVIVGPNFYDKEMKLLKMLRPKLIVLSTRMTQQKVESMIELCRLEHVPIHQLTTSPLLVSY